jgi:hypothetical protein
MTRREVFIILAVFVVTRIAVVVIGVVAMRVFPTTEGPEFKHLLDGGPALDMWYRWDAGFYATIAIEGYDWYNKRQVAADLAFLPLYPLAVHFASGLTPTGCALSPYLSTCATIGGLMVSNAGLLASAFLLYDIARRHTSDETAVRAVVLLLIAPNLIFLSGVYTEALFLLLCLLTFWLLERDRFALAVGVACLACLTRPVGLALYPALLWWAWKSPPHSSPTQAATGRSVLRPYRLILAHLPVLVLTGYVLLTGWWVGEPLAFFQANSLIWGRGFSSPVEAFTVYLRGGPIAIYGFRPAWIELAATLFYLVLAVLVWRKNTVCGLFALAALLIPIATGTLWSMPRFGAVIFPFYILIAAWTDRWWKQVIVYGASAALALLFISRFVTWRWIA